MAIPRCACVASPDRAICVKTRWGDLGADEVACRFAPGPCRPESRVSRRGGLV